MSNANSHQPTRRQTPVDDRTHSDESFLGRWSRRKLQTRDEPRTWSEPEESVQAEVPVPAPEAKPAVGREPGIASDHESAASDPPPPSDADMPPLDSVTADSDVSGFLSPRVSETLRKAALQRLFQQPEFNVMDGLDDYCEDYRNFKPLGEVVTADMRHRLEVIQQRLKRFVADDAQPATQSTQTQVATRQETTATDEPTDGNA